MTDKVQKIREEIERLKLCTMDEHMGFYSEAAEAEYNALCNIEHFIDSLQEEPVRNGLMSRKEDCLGCDRRRLEIVTFKKMNGESVDIYMCRGLLDTPCPKGHDVFAR